MKKYFIKIKKLLNANSSKISHLDLINHSARIENSVLNGTIKVGEFAWIHQSILVGDVEIGRYSTINGPNTDIFTGVHHVNIGSFCSIARSVSIQEYNHNINFLSSYMIQEHIFDEDWKTAITSKGPIIIGNDVWIGAQCVILSGSNIGDGSVIAANSVVNGTIPPYAIAAGSPAKIIGYRFNDEVINKLTEIKWWNWDIIRIKENKTLFYKNIILEDIIDL